MAGVVLQPSLKQFTPSGIAGLAVRRRKRKPIENVYIESFNGKFRDECLNEHWFLIMAHARRTIEEWRMEYGGQRPHIRLQI